MGVIVLRLFFISTTSSSSLPFFTICFRFSSFVSYIKRWKDSIQLTKQTTKSLYSSLFVWRMEDNVRFKRRNTSFTLETALMNSLSKRPTKVEKNANWIHIQYEAWVAVAIIIILFFFFQRFFFLFFYAKRFSLRLILWNQLTSICAGIYSVSLLRWMPFFAHKYTSNAHTTTHAAAVVVVVEGRSGTIWKLKKQKLRA